MASRVGYIAACRTAARACINAVASMYESSGNSRSGYCAGAFDWGPKLSICGTKSCADFCGIGSPEAARRTVSMVIEAPIPMPIAAIISTVSAMLRRRLRSARLK